MERVDATDPTLALFRPVLLRGRGPVVWNTHYFLVCLVAVVCYLRVQIVYSFWIPDGTQQLCMIIPLGIYNLLGGLH